MRSRAFPFSLGLRHDRRLLVDDVGIAEAVVLPGSLKAVAQVLFAPEQARQAMAERKTEVFGQFATLHPEARFVFIGDSGEGDIDFAEEFMARTDGPVRAALIHDVVRHPSAKNTPVCVARLLCCLPESC